MELLGKAVPFAMLGFVVSSMLAVGLSLTLSQIAAPLRNMRLVAISLVANFVLVALLVRISDAARRPPTPHAAPPPRLGETPTEVVSP